MLWLPLTKLIDATPDPASVIAPVTVTTAKFVNELFAGDVILICGRVVYHYRKACCAGIISNIVAETLKVRFPSAMVAVSTSRR